ncbi:MAG: DUF1343 domain-containing protein [Bacteroidales bacterium]|nr:DUF1343 domain-containing protein [Bacteroidales bacterium]
MLFRNSLRHFVCASAFVLTLLPAACQTRPAAGGTGGFAVSAARSPVVKPGIEVLEARGFDVLQGKRIGLLTNPSGVDRHLRTTIDILHHAPGVQLVRLFGPEHGVRGDAHAGDATEDAFDPATGLKCYSLYGKYRQPTAEMLKGLDAVVYDIQDVGVRCYTFISSLGLMMRTCAEQGIEVIVLDRPNPLGGLKVEGSYVQPGFFSFVGQYRIPYVYGLTVGELARLINGEDLNCGQKGDLAPLKCKLTVVPMEGWERRMLYEDTGLPWVMPSPQIPYAETTRCYPSAGIAGDAGYLNIGVGYTLPFACFAAEWIDAGRLKARLEDYALPGVAFREIHYKPFFGASAGKLLHGVQYYYTDYEAASLTLLQFYVMQALKELYPERDPFAKGSFSMFDKICGTDYVRVHFKEKYKVSDILGYWSKDVAEFRSISEKYYIY